MDCLLEDTLEWNMACSKPRDTSPETLKQAVDLIKEEVQELLTAVDLEDEVEIADACVDIVWVVAGLMYQRFGYVKTTDLFEEVSRSNYSKLTGPADDIEKEIEEFSKIGVEVRHVGNDMIGAFLDNNNKVRKPSWFKQPDIAGVLNE
jgi:NTP pyrophosphatase (non-canonical NTP hydrolase)